MRKLLIFGLLLGAVPAAAQDIDVGTGDWSAVPPLVRAGQFQMGEAHMDRIEQIGAAGDCRVPGLGRAAVNLRVPFVIRYGASGAIEQVVVRDLGCPRLELVLGTAALQLAQAGEYLRPVDAEGWYRGEISFANQ